MDIKTFILELWDLLKKEKWLITVVTMCVAILSLAVLFIQRFDFNTSGKSEDLEQTGIPTIFEAFVEEEYVGAFTNSYLMEIILTQEDTIDEIEYMTQIDIANVLEEYAEENDPIYSSEDPINVERNTSSNVLEITFNLGTEEENLSVADAYADWIIENDVEFFDNKNVYLVSEPDYIEGEELAMTSNELSIARILIQGALGIVFGLIVGFVISVLKVLLNDKIKYGFTYGWAADELYIKESKDEKDSKIAYDILSSNVESLVVLSENILGKSLVDEITHLKPQNIKLIKDISELSIDEVVDEFVFIITRDETTKDWYHSQRKNLRLHPEVRVKIVEK